MLKLPVLHSPGLNIDAQVASLQYLLAKYLTSNKGWSGNLVSPVCCDVQKVGNSPQTSRQLRSLNGHLLCKKSMYDVIAQGPKKQIAAEMLRSHEQGQLRYCMAWLSSRGQQQTCLLRAQFALLSQAEGN